MKAIESRTSPRGLGRPVGWWWTVSSSRLCLLAWATAFVLAFASVPARAQSIPAADEVEVIVHPGVDTRYLTRNFLRSVFTLRVRVWPDGDPIHIFVLDDASVVHGAFSRDILGTYPYILRRAWNRTTFTGTGLVPARVDSVQEMRRRVAATPGAVGYVPKAAIDATLHTLYAAQPAGEKL